MKVPITVNQTVSWLMMKFFDKNKDGRIDRNELFGAVSSILSAGSVEGAISGQAGYNNQGGYGNNQGGYGGNQGGYGGNQGGYGGNQGGYGGNQGNYGGNQGGYGGNQGGYGGNQGGYGGNQGGFGGNQGGYNGGYNGGYWSKNDLNLFIIHLKI